MVFNDKFFNRDPHDSTPNTLLQYLQRQNPELLTQIAQSASPEVQEIITQNVQGLIGMLPSDDFGVQITTERESLANLLASAMMTGYFLRQVEHRRDLETILSDTDSLNY
ncbi:DUF760 domain-containing protein [Gloeocapsa sp. PCC 73106]|uniref:DUF760 domain-containing protein n=1 Tax=Gloeocapsa sp. PCC 73106 TaxID=102232 RepID=UPI0002ABE1C2|nr:DUF760 domain-containing protein [Gloeocapsa sp. PCC 73106]ELR99350.1 Protein of unknown function (DUF760) [Gloeocapsa sp. PCC 73106]